MTDFRLGLSDLSGHEADADEIGDSMSERDIAGSGGVEIIKDRSEDRDGGKDCS